MTTERATINKIELIVLLSVLALTVLVYMPGLEGPLLLDDYPRLGVFFEDSELSRDDLENQMQNNPAALKRPVSMLSFIGNYLYNGDNLYAWKLTNLLIHLLCGIVWFCFLKVIEKALSVRSGIKCQYLALVAATIWLLHPLQVSTTLYLVQRMAQLSTLFIALGMLFYALGRLRQIKGQEAKLYLFISIFIFLPLAVLSKENGVVLPLLILVTELSLFRFAASPLLNKEFKVYLTGGILLPILVGIGVLIIYFDSLVLQGYGGRPFSLDERLLTELRVICMYLGQILWPIPSSMQFFYENIFVSESLTKPITTALALVVILLLLVFSWLARKKMPLFTFGILFYFGSISVESSILPLELAFEHRNYIGLLGVSVAGYSLIASVISKSVIKHVSYLLIIIMLSLATASRAATWSSKTSLYNYYYRLNPESPRVVSMIAEELAKQERYSQALRLLAGVNANGARLQSFYIQCLRGDDLENVDYKRLAEKISSPIDNYAITGIIEIANLGLDGQCNMSLEGYEAFLANILSRTFRDADDRFKISMYHAHYLWQTDKRDEALTLLEGIAYGEYTSPVPLFLAAKWALDIGNETAALDYLQKAEQMAKSKGADYSTYSNNLRKRLASSAN